MDNLYGPGTIYTTVHHNRYSMANPIKIIDLFAGPGGLGEGFSAVRRDDGTPAFKIRLSVEKDVNAHQTLQLRAFYRQFNEGEAPDAYYEYLDGFRGEFPEDSLFRETAYKKQVEAAKSESRRLTLGVDNKLIHSAIADALGKRPGPWVLIGGPPCQAYSIAGRVRNKGIKSYDPNKDERSFLYREYLEIIARFRPAVFVMENVKGMLSAKIGGKQIFPQIKSDLESPAAALKLNEPNVEYELFSLSNSKPNSDLFSKKEQNPKDFIVEAEKHGIPQSRHRVIIVGIRKELSRKSRPKILSNIKPPTVRSVISNLPKLRSGLSREPDSFNCWTKAVTSKSTSLTKALDIFGLDGVSNNYREALSSIHSHHLETGSNWGHGSRTGGFGKLEPDLVDWYTDESGWRGVCNHETRKHIREDLHRYLFCACYARAFNSDINPSPKAHCFPREFYPDHANWETGDFNDRFRVQAGNRPATTITSHMSKDGHYFIHYDPKQCRSLTVREAARIQTFPDSYFFVGPRTAQYIQVGNAVPPYLAYKISSTIYNLIMK